MPPGTRGVTTSANRLPGNTTTNCVKKEKKTTIQSSSYPHPFSKIHFNIILLYPYGACCLSDVTLV